MKRTAFVSAFTLIELLVVVSLIAASASLLVFSLSGGGSSVALQSSQATVANLLTGARLQAAATGRKTRVLLNIDAAVPDRFLHTFVWQRARQPGTSPTDWDTQQTVALEETCYAMPASLTLAVGLVEESGQWRRPSNANQLLVSDLFTGQQIVLALEGETTAQVWTGVAFTPQGTLAALSGGLPPNGVLLIATGRKRAPGTYGEGESPVRLTNPQGVRGLMLSAYGVPALINDREAL